MIEVVSVETNAEKLKNVPHQNMEDVVVVYRFILDSNENGRASILATSKCLMKWGTPEQLHADANMIRTSAPSNTKTGAGQHTPHVL